MPFHLIDGFSDEFKRLRLTTFAVCIGMMLLSGCGTTVVYLDESGREIYETSDDMSDEERVEFMSDLATVSSMMVSETDDEKVSGKALTQLDGMTVEEIHEQGGQF